MAKIPFDKSLGKTNSEGEIISNERLHSPWSNVEEYLDDIDLFQKSALLRAFQVYSDKDEDKVKYYDELFGEIDALNFYEKNKGRTTEGKLKKLTVILGIAFVVGSVILGVLYVI